VIWSQVPSFCSIASSFEDSASGEKLDEYLHHDICQDGNETQVYPCEAMVMVRNQLHDEDDNADHRRASGISRL
jgi:hypothetical protein